MMFDPKFDSILDKQFIDFDLEENNTKLLNMLLEDTVVVQHMTTRQKINLLYDRQKFQSFIELYKKNSSTLNSEYRGIEEAYKILKENQEDGDLAQLYTCELMTSGTVLLYAFTILSIIKRYHAELEVTDFLFCVINFENDEKNDLDISATFIFNELKKSRINYILNNTYLPVVCEIGGNKHATSILILPQVGQNDSMMTWNCVYINSNGDRMTYRNRDQIVSIGLAKYQDWILKQKHSRRTPRNYHCESNIQQKYSTCGHWALFLAFRLLQDFHNNNNSIRNVTAFCEFLSDKTEDHEIHDMFNDFIIDTRSLYKCLIVETVNSINNKIQSEDNEFPGIEVYSRFLLHEGKHQHLELNIEIMKSLGNLQLLRHDFEISKDDRVEEKKITVSEEQKITGHQHSLSPTQAQKERRSTQRIMVNLKSLNLKNLRSVMFNLNETSENPLNEVTTEKGLEFVRDFGLLLSKFNSKQHFLDWLHYWYILYNKSKRQGIRFQNSLNGREKRPILHFNVAAKSQIENFFQFTSDLLRRQLTGQFSKWILPASFYTEPKQNIHKHS